MMRLANIFNLVWKGKQKPFLKNYFNVLAVWDPSSGPGIEPVSLVMEAWRFSQWTAREVLKTFLHILKYSQNINYETLKKICKPRLNSQTLMELPTFLCTVSDALKDSENLGWDTPCHRARGLQTKAGISGDLLGQSLYQIGVGGLSQCSIYLPAVGPPLLPLTAPTPQVDSVASRKCAFYSSFHKERLLPS